MAQSTSSANSQDTDSVSVTKKLEEELTKRDALIEVCHFLQFQSFIYFTLQFCCFT